jgi:hypothetical protein
MCSTPTPDSAGPRCNMHTMTPSGQSSDLPWQAVDLRRVIDSASALIHTARPDGHWRDYDRPSCCQNNSCRAIKGQSCANAESSERALLARRWHREMADTSAVNCHIWQSIRNIGRLEPVIDAIPLGECGILVLAF